MQAARVYIKCSPYPPELLNLLEHVEALAVHPVEPGTRGSRALPSKPDLAHFNRTWSEEQDDHQARIRAASLEASQKGWRSTGEVTHAPPRWRSLRPAEFQKVRSVEEFDPFPLPRHGDHITGGFGNDLTDKFRSRHASPFPVGSAVPRRFSSEFRKYHS